MKVATFNVNGVNGRLPRLLEWLAESTPGRRLPAGDQDRRCHIPGAAIEDAGYGALWHGQRSHHGVALLAKGETPIEIRRGLPGDPADLQTRYLEARVKGVVIASIYLPNGNPLRARSSTTS